MRGIMYGKAFSRMYQGSMVGSGSHVFAVWGYCISNADYELHNVDLNPTLLATVLGETVERVEQAIAFLCAPDPKSHCPDHNGARLVHQTGFAYFLPTHALYRDMKNSEELRAYFREKQRAYRSGEDVKDSSDTPVSVSDISMAGFDEFWAAYPKKKNKQEAIKAWKQTKKIRPELTKIIATLQAEIASKQWSKDGGQYIPNPATWLRAGGWDNQPELTKSIRWRRMNPPELMPEGFEPKPEEINRVYMKTEVK